MIAFASYIVIVSPVQSSFLGSNCQNWDCNWSYFSVGALKTGPDQLGLVTIGLV
jgi:hypothetical protein